VSPRISVVSTDAREQYEPGLIFECQKFVESLDTETSRNLTRRVGRLQVTDQDGFVRGSDCRSRLVNNNRPAQDCIEGIDPTLIGYRPQ
jgi:hypothetical protein